MNPQQPSPGPAGQPQPPQQQVPDEHRPFNPNQPGQTTQPRQPPGPNNRGETSTPSQLGDGQGPGQPMPKSQ